MRIIEPSVKIITPISKDGYFELKQLELAARNCYKSEDKITEDTTSAKKLVGFLIKNEHEAMLEHSTLTVRFICDRAVSHELVRHRMASFAQESQRYCNYSNHEFGCNVCFVRPTTITEGTQAYDIWKKAMAHAEAYYFDMLDFGLTPQEARAVLPNSTKTEVIVTANYREWRHILKLRTSLRAHPDIRRLMLELAGKLRAQIPVVFDDIPETTKEEKHEEQL